MLSPGINTHCTPQAPPLKGPSTLHAGACSGGCVLLAGATEMGTLLATCGCQNRLPQTWCLKVTELYSHHSGARHLEPRYRQDWFLLETPRRTCRASLLVPWLVGASLQSPSPSSHGLLSVSVPLLFSSEDLPLDVGSPSIQEGLILRSLITLARTLFSEPGHIHRFRVDRHIFGDHHSSHYRDHL